jgi:hypothetical protein
MATKVRFAIPEREIEQNGVTFKRETDKGRHGELTVHQNHLIWRPKGNEYVFRISWEKLGEFAEEKGKREYPKATVVKARKRLKNASE